MKKIKLNKITVSNLNAAAMKNAKAGSDTYYDATCTHYSDSCPPDDPDTFVCFDTHYWILNTGQSFCGSCGCDTFAECNY